MTYTYCRVYSTRLLMMDRKPAETHTEFYSKNKFEKLVQLVHLVDFITRIYHDARSSECQMGTRCSSAVKRKPPMDADETFEVISDTCTVDHVLIYTSIIQFVQSSIMIILINTHTCKIFITASNND